jgi:membrane protease YdiL (CAAX protease family)
MIHTEGSAPPAPPAPPKRASRAIELGYVIAFIGAELAGISRPLVGALCESVLLVALVNQYAFTDQRRRQPLLLALAVVCLYRLLALTPIHGNPIINRLVIVGAPVLLGAILALRHFRSNQVLAPRSARHVGGMAAQYLIALSGVPLSWAAYKVFKPTVTITFRGPGHAAGSEILLAVAALAVFSGLLEELVFRGLVHAAARTSFGPSALYVSAAVFGAAYLGTGSAAIVAFVVAVGAFFGWCYEGTESVAGVALAHAIIAVGVFVVWPSVGGHLGQLHL